MAKEQTPPIESRGDNTVLFERYRITSRALDTCIIVQSKEENAILLKDGIAYDTIEGGRNYIFDKKELANQEALIVEVIFMSKSAKCEILWGTAMEVEDPVYQEHIKIGINGNYDITVGTPRQFYEVLVGRDQQFRLENLKRRLDSKMLPIIQNAIAAHMAEQKMSYLGFNQNLLEIAKSIEPTIRKYLREEYGLAMKSLVIENIAIQEPGKSALLRKKDKIQNKDEYEMRQKQAREDEVAAREHSQRMDMRSMDVMERAVGGSNSTQSNEISCPHCGTKNPATNKFCGNCGKSPKNVCPDCKIEYPLAQKFCGSCGKKLHD